jgi:hypothetical protein
VCWPNRGFVFTNFSFVIYFYQQNGTSENGTTNGTNGTNGHHDESEETPATNGNGEHIIEVSWLMCGFFCFFMDNCLKKRCCS